MPGILQGIIPGNQVPVYTRFVRTTSLNHKKSTANSVQLSSAIAQHRSAMRCGAVRCRALLCRAVPCCVPCCTYSFVHARYHSKYHTRYRYYTRFVRTTVHQLYHKKSTPSSVQLSYDSSAAQRRAFFRTYSRTRDDTKYQVPVCTCVLVLLLFPLIVLSRSCPCFTRPQTTPVMPTRT